jgi:hypothetical protein
MVPSSGGARAEAPSVDKRDLRGDHSVKAANVTSANRAGMTRVVPLRLAVVRPGEECTGDMEALREGRAGDGGAELPRDKTDVVVPLAAVVVTDLGSVRRGEAGGVLRRAAGTIARQVGGAGASGNAGARWVKGCAVHNQVGS